MQITALEEELQKRVKEELEPIDVDVLYDEMLDECYSFEQVGGIFAGMLPSAVLEKCDPIAYRCGHADYFDSLSREREYEEIDEELYQADEVQAIRDELETEGDEE